MIEVTAERDPTRHLISGEAYPRHGIPPLSQHDGTNVSAEVQPGWAGGGDQHAVVETEASIAHMRLALPLPILRSSEGGISPAAVVS